MKQPRGINEWLADIVKSGEKLARHIEGYTLETFLKDEKTQDAAAKCVEEVGGAAYEILKLNSDFDSLHSDLRFSDAYGSRNRLSHGYYSIDYRLLWNTASKAIPLTVKAASEILAQRQAEENKDENDGGDGSGGGISGGP